jgi:ribose transport system permease protein
VTTQTIEELASQPRNEQPKRSFASVLRNEQFVLLLAFLAMVLFFGLRSKYFFTSSTAENTLNDFAPLALLAVGEMFVIVSGGIDLSIGAIQGFSGVVSALLIRNLTLSHAGESPVAPDWHPNIVLGLGLLTAVLVGTGIGLINAFMITKVKLVPFVATLVTLGSLFSFATVFSGGRSVGEGPVKTIPLAVHWFGPFSRPVLVILLVLFLVGLLLHHTRFGRYTFAIGSNEFAARGAGINVSRHTFKVYGFAGFLAGLSGFYLYLRLGSGAPTTGFGTELAAIAAVVIGGASLTGGVGKIVGTLLGALMISTIFSGLIQVGVSPNWQRNAVAALIFVAAALQANSFGKRNRK